MREGGGVNDWGRSHVSSTFHPDLGDNLLSLAFLPFSSSFSKQVLRVYSVLLLGLLLPENAIFWPKNGAFKKFFLIFSQLVSPIELFFGLVSFSQKA